MNDLIKELRDMVGELSSQLEYHDPNSPLIDKADKILSRHEAEQGEGLREFEAWFSLFVARLYDNGHIKKDDPMFEAYKKFRAMMEKHPTPNKAVEPLAVLAKRKGYHEYQFLFENKYYKWTINLRGYAPYHEIVADTAEECSAKVRAYLEALPDKGEK